jgi:hypothetical protein
MLSSAEIVYSPFVAGVRKTGETDSLMTNTVASSANLVSRKQLFNGSCI